MGGKCFEICSQLAVDILDKMMPDKICKQKVPSIRRQRSPGKQTNNHRGTTQPTSYPRNIDNSAQQSIDEGNTQSDGDTV